ncbi:MAG: hypothetical protein Q4G68_05635 [Planctomycetia bacterium]|nr:hypothetical protein [Planctomycetia bacterium]
MILIPNPGRRSLRSLAPGYVMLALQAVGEWRCWVNGESIAD